MVDYMKLKALQHSSLSRWPFLITLLFRFSSGEAEDLNLEKLKAEAERGDAQAEFRLGQTYFRGEGVSKDCKEAAEWYRKAAEQDLAEAELYLGACDDGVDRNYAEADKWLSKAAAHGQPWAQNALGVMYENGLGVQMDVQEALKWFRQAAEKGEPKAQSNLGRMYALGTGVDMDLVQAYQWLTLSADQGEFTAKKFLAWIEPRLTGDQIAEGKRLASEWKERASRNAEAN